MLIEGPFRPIRPLAGFDRASIMPIDLVSSSPESFLPIIIVLFSLLNFLCFLLEFDEPAAEFVALVDKFPHLGEEDNIGEIESAILVVVVEVFIFIVA